MSKDKEEEYNNLDDKHKKFIDDLMDSHLDKIENDILKELMEKHKLI